MPDRGRIIHRHPFPPSSHLLLLPATVSVIFTATCFFRGVCSDCVHLPTCYLPCSSRPSDFLLHRSANCGRRVTYANLRPAGCSQPHNTYPLASNPGLQDHTLPILVMPLKWLCVLCQLPHFPPASMFAFLRS